MTALVPESEPSHPTDTDTARDYERYLEILLGRHFVGGNRLQVLRNGVEIFPAMLEAIRQAESSVNMLTYVYWTGGVAKEFADALASRARDGLEVRLMLDAIGARPMNEELIDEMRRGGVDIRWFRSPRRLRFWQSDNRTHRKVLVCDHRVGFTGGVGIAEEWSGDARTSDEWRETHVRLEGPAVDGLSGAFWDDWLKMGNEQAPEIPARRRIRINRSEHRVMVVRSTATDKASDVENLLKALLHLARERLWVCTPYMVVDDAISRLICQTAERGVDVRFVIPGQYIDKRFEQLAAEKHFEQLMDAGVNIYRYQQTMIHAKVMLLDDVLAKVGSANFNQRSMKKDDEALLVTTDPDTVALLRCHFEEDLQACTHETDTKWLDRSIGHRAAEVLMRPFREQL